MSAKTRPNKPGNTFINIPVSKTIKLPAGLKSSDDFCTEIEASGHKVGIWGKDIVVKAVFTARDKEFEVDLVFPTVLELGFLNSTTRAQIYERAIELGLQLCPPELGPELRKQYRNQPKNEWLLIGMQPIVDSDGVESVFTVAEGGDAFWISADRGRANICWRLSSRWVFIKPRK